MFGFFEYDENGQKTKLTQWMPTDDTIAEFTFDEYGGQKKIRILSSDGTVVSETKYKNEYEFDKKGNPVEQRQIDEDGKLCTVIKRQFNKKGVIELMKSYSVNEDGKKILDYEITTDEKGSEERFTEYDHDGNVTEVQQYKNKYDDNDNLKKVTAYNSETKAELYTMIYHQEKLSEYLKNKEDFDKRAQEKIEEGK